VNIGGFSKPVLGSILNVFNLRSVKTKAEFEKIVEPGYLSVKELHDNYIKTFVDHRDIISTTDMHHEEMYELLNKFDDDIFLSEDQRNQLVAITHSISEKNYFEIKRVMIPRV